MFELSNKKFYKTKKVQEQLDNYYKEQAKKSKLWRDTKQYERYVARMGRENVGTLSSFRRVKNANSDRYLDLKEEYRSYGIENKKAFEEHTKEKD